MALSNPTSKTEGVPAGHDRAGRKAGHWSPPAARSIRSSYGDRVIPVSQCNNVYVFPGVGMGAIVSGAREVTERMFAAAAETLADLVAESDLGRGALYPPIEELRPISRPIAAAVARRAMEEGVAPKADAATIDAELDRQIWDLEYPRLHAV